VHSRTPPFWAAGKGMLLRNSSFTISWHEAL
jgi:hypothetical protein